MTTLDMLGEQSQSVNEVNHVTETYRPLYESIFDSSLNCNTSVKLTHLGLDHNDALAEKNILSLLDKAKNVYNFLRVNMEISFYTDATLKIYENCKKSYQGVGLVLQACLRRSLDDLKRIITKNGNVRICKNHFQNQKDIRDNFIKRT